METFICKLCLAEERVVNDDGSELCRPCQRALNLAELPTDEQMAFIRRHESESESYLRRRA